jgi:small subunit ribosomal protein S2
MSNNNNLIERLFNAGAHFGFSKSRRHPTVAPYIYGNKQGTDIFDLEKTAALLKEAKEVIKEAGLKGKTVLFVGTKDEVSKMVLSYAEKAESPYVVNRWIGGMLTNFSEIRKRIARLKELLAEKESGELERKYTKKERVVLGREVDKLQFNFGGISTIERTPQLMVVVDPRHDEIAVTEAKDMKIPIIGVMSSDCDLKSVTSPVVVNDALTASVDLVLGELVNAYLEGKEAYVPPPAKPRTPHRGPRN